MHKRALIYLVVVGMLLVGWLGYSATTARMPESAPVLSPSTDATLTVETRLDATAPGHPAAAPRSPASIHEYALSPYTRAGYPKLFAKWGAKGIKRAEKLRKAAAEKAALSTDCDGVEIVELSDQRSVPPDNIVIFVDCTNTRRFYFTEVELAAPSSAVASEATKGKAITAVDATETCVAAFKAGGRYSDDLAYSFHTSDPRFVESNGRWIVELIAPQSEKAKLAPSWARCIIIPGQPLVVDYADY